MAALYTNELDALDALLAAKAAEIERVQQERTAERAQHQQALADRNRQIAELEEQVLLLKAQLYDYIIELGHVLSDWAGSEEGR